ncbi:hypothetical protein Ga0609869_000487 [Rhodovulum iodosum]|uniref:Roadblock/LAMTOR2 domain-containing protein n=1 Tax=Rhodovulum iodosum TaxID=68291 RepID=A0ABV3XPK0_9RHOB|nr:hypothetical protein [Rhodovulum robiginosum]RSK31562.1 hypothetical protein EJA01_15655 [Rhodovulum robiginosum]
MDIAEQIQELREDIPTCRTVALIDLSVRLVLCASSGDRLPQEALDALCARAKALLDGDAAVAFASAGTAGPEEGMVLCNGELQVFLRSTAAPHEALCCVCAADIDYEPVLDRLRRGLTEIAEA